MSAHMQIPFCKIKQLYFHLIPFAGDKGLAGGRGPPGCEGKIGAPGRAGNLGQPGQKVWLEIQHRLFHRSHSLNLILSK